MERIGIVVNPKAGRGAARPLAERLDAYFRARGRAVEIRETEGVSDAARLARAFADAGVDLIVAVGGDGTVGGAVDGLMTSENPGVAFSLAAAGTGCDFARQFAMPTDPERLAAHILDAPERRIDVGRMTCVSPQGALSTSHFVNEATAGISGEVVCSVNGSALRAILPGRHLFTLHSVTNILAWRSKDLLVSLDGGVPERMRADLVAVCNGAYFGGGMHVAPEAELADGLFDVVILTTGSRLKLVSLLGQIRAGRHLTDPAVRIVRAASVRVEPADGTSAGIPTEADGEATGVVPVEFGILPAALTLKV
ncbi:diacylglycerol/lipid kinase family protein [Rhizobium sp. PAMB 3182]